MSESKIKKPARLERRVRVTFFLVAETKEQKEAVIDLIYYLNAQFSRLKLEGKSELPITGFTHSAIHSGAMPRKDMTLGKMFEKAIFWGHWWTEEKEEENTESSMLSLIQERVVFFVIDLLAVAEEWKIDENVIVLKNKIFEFYEEWESPQEEIWIVKQDIYRYA